MSLRNWTGGEFRRRSGSWANRFSIRERYPGTFVASWYTSVGTTVSSLSRLATLEKKYDPASVPSSPQESPNDWATADFPVPAEPRIQSIFCSSCSLESHCVSLSLIFNRVSGWHFGGGYRALESLVASRHVYGSNNSKTAKTKFNAWSP
jgi:hypothetical protein